MDPTSPKSYAEVAAGVCNNTGPERSQAQQYITEERWKYILTPCKTPRKLAINFINHNPFDALNDEETQKENELLKEMEATEPRGTSTPKSKARAAKKRKAINFSSSVEESRREKGKNKGKKMNGPNLAM
ncbi:hypothetical protein ACJMK2_039229 [Sinanodonta woodiana]|uniref:Uncharacterized protein n=1 Tax=Sinanodonta woodiana TaxID=1069815 RepID=A0ABD3WBC7_SINWO